MSAPNRLAANSTARSARGQKPFRASAQAADHLSVPELLDLLEDALAKGKHAAAGPAAATLDLFPAPNSSDGTKAADVHWKIQESRTGAEREGNFRECMRAAGLSSEQFARVFAVPMWMVNRWLEADAEVPDWVWPAIRFYELLPAAERQGLLAARQGQGRRNAHPFSRIEDL